MLEELHVRDLALIEEVWLEFGPGMTVLTGETGAGKTALVGALKLLLGERGDSNMVRAGSASALVEGRFSTPDGDEVFARRTISAEGRSKCVLNGEMATVGLLAEGLGGLVDLHGQHDHQALLRPARHVSYLDGYIGDAVTAAADDYRTAREEHRMSKSVLAELEATLAEGERRADYLHFVVSEIDAVAPEPDEDIAIERRLPALRHGERLAEAADEARGALRGDGGATDSIGRAQAALSRVDSLDPELDKLALRFVELVAGVDDLGSELRAYGESVVHDPAELDAAESRLSALTGLIKKHGPSLQMVIETAESARAELEMLDAGEQGLERARSALGQTESRLREAAMTLRQVRSAAIPSFVDALGSAVADLSMEGAGFDVQMTELPFESWTSDGPDRVEFMFAPAPGQPPRPLARIASGGEVSRVMLALKGVLGDADDVPILVFDEVDAGIGGATAHAVGARLKRLARGHQVLVITHLAQVAVHADHHLVVRKELEGSSAHTSVSTVTDDRRVQEVARMLSGGDSEASMLHARELMAAATSVG
ncbi:MAG: DNA repair protein RecN [Actinomycetota bacterium]|nr:DNA repair protein RecN [Actinomycetota bacterium]